MEDELDEALTTAFRRAIQALERMLTTLHRASGVAAGLHEAGIARRLDELAGDVEQSLHGLRSRAAHRSNNISSRRDRR